MGVTEGESVATILYEVKEIYEPFCALSQH